MFSHDFTPYISPFFHSPCDFRQEQNSSRKRVKSSNSTLWAAFGLAGKSHWIFHGKLLEVCAKWWIVRIGTNGILKKWLDLGVSKNRGGPPKWMVYFMENPTRMDDLGGPFFWKHPFCLPSLKLTYPLEIDLLLNRKWIVFQPSNFRGFRC